MTLDCRGRAKQMAAIVLAVLFTCRPTAVTAAECARTYFLDYYRSGMADTKSGHVVQAEKAFRTLAEQGFAPAQRRLGEILVGNSAKPESRQEGLLWLKLATRAGDPLAAEAQKIANATKDEDSAARQAATGWHAEMPECMRAFGDRLAKGQQVSLKDFVTDVKMQKGADGQNIAKGLMQRFSAIYGKDPGFLPYIRALSVVAVGKHGLAAQAVRTAGATMVILDEQALTNPDSKRLNVMLEATVTAIRVSVHDEADPPSRLTAIHGGRTITAIGHADASQAVEVIRAGIDLAEALPPDLREHARRVKKLHYEVPSMGVDVKLSGTTYARPVDTIWFQGHPSNTSARGVAAALVANGVYAEYKAHSLDADRKAAYAGRRALDILP